jgi:hypothetical protein
MVLFGRVPADDPAEILKIDPSKRPLNPSTVFTLYMLILIEIFLTWKLRAEKIWQIYLLYRYTTSGAIPKRPALGLCKNRDLSLSNGDRQQLIY